MYFSSNKDGIKIDDKYVLMHALVVLRTKPKLFKNIFQQKNHMRLLHATIANGTKELHFDSFSRKESLTMLSLS